MTLVYLYKIAHNRRTIQSLLFFLYNGLVIIMNSTEIALVKEHEVYRYFREYLEFPEDMAVELTYDVLVTS